MKEEKRVFLVKFRDEELIENIKRYKKETGNSNTSLFRLSIRKYLKDVPGFKWEDMTKDSMV